MAQTFFDAVAATRGVDSAILSDHTKPTLENAEQFRKFGLILARIINNLWSK